jgi:serine/threonine protein kinase
MGGGSSKPAAGTIEDTKKFKDDYIIQHELGTGAFSVVKQCKRKINGHLAAVKIIEKEGVSESDLVNLKEEIDILSSMNHEHIIKCEGHYDEPKTFYIVTELVAGGELFDRIVQKTYYSEKDARDLIRIFLKTMAYVHEQGVVHRDLKPENLLLVADDDDSDIKIADFGLAKRLTDLKPNEPPCGTPAYVAPEIIRNEPYGVEVDIWSIGVTCYVLLAGYPPFYDEDMRKLFRKIKEGKYHFHEQHWSDKSPESMDCIRKMLAVNPKERWTAKQLLDHAWVQTDDEALQTRNINSTLVVMRKFNARRRFKAAANAVIMTNRMKKLIEGLTKMREEDAHIEKTGDVLPDDDSHMVVPEYVSNVSTNEATAEAEAEAATPAAPE